MRESTKVLFKKHGWRVDRMIHNYIYLAWYYPYVKIVCSFLKLINFLTWIKPIKHAARIAYSRYHSKILSGSDAKKIFTLNKDINLVSDENKRIVPFKYAYKIIFKDHEYIAVMDCPCKKSLGAPADTINSCIAVGSGIGKFWVDRCKKYNAHQVTQMEALKLVEHYRKKGYITQIFFKVATGGSTGIICNCHPDFCVNLLATRITRKFDKNLTMWAKSGYSIKRNKKKCKKCGTCAQICHFGAFTMGDDGTLYDKNECVGCGLCTEHCPNGALSLYVDSDKPLPLDLDYVKKKEKDILGVR